MGVEASAAHGPGVRHEPRAARFVTIVDGVLARLDYQLGEGTLAITHTVVPPAIGGRGIAAALVRAAVEFARDSGLKVIPACAYAEAWLRRHPEYDDLRA